MADKLPLVVREIEHVVTAPYIPVLQVRLCFYEGDGQLLIQE